MAVPSNPNTDPQGPRELGLGAQNYTSLGSLLDPTKPDVRELYVETFGDQGLTGFLDLTGAVRNAGTSDEVEWYEEGRLHRTVTIDSPTGAVAAGASGTFTVDTSNSIDQDDITAADQVIRPNDVLLNGSQRLIVQTVGTGTTLTFTAIASSAITAGEYDGVEFAVIGNMYAQGTGQPDKFYQTSLTKRRNSYIITKDTFHVNGSQASNIGWLKVNGQYRWYVKGEMDARKRFMNQREAMMLWSDGSSTSPSSITVQTADGAFNKSEGYFAAVANRGITADGFTNPGTGNVAGQPTLADLDAIILELDKEGAVNEYAMYLNRDLSLAIDDMLAAGIAGNSITSGLASQFGAFNNSEDMAVKLGFKSFQRGGYTFHKHDWKILNDPTMGGLGDVKGAMVPMTQVADAKTGIKAPALEMNYKAANGYSRDIEHWVEGGGVLGFNTNDEDVAKFHYRSECNLVTRAANQHVLLK
jgi:hypothetical protein